MKKKSFYPYPVAPYVGAWIETRSIPYCCSLPLSHPTWVRGLKRHRKHSRCCRFVVAPYVGAWIETLACLRSCEAANVAPYVGAWIETPRRPGAPPLPCVAPYVGAWIETFVCDGVQIRRRSHPTWVRGLKHRNWLQRESRRESHPTWVRGLKPRASPPLCALDVAPYVGAWIETSRRARRPGYSASHPTWVRGLKPNSGEKVAKHPESHPTWVRGLKLVVAVKMSPLTVAPYVGAWIET